MKLVAATLHLIGKIRKCSMEMNGLILFVYFLPHSAVTGHLVDCAGPEKAAVGPETHYLCSKYNKRSHDGCDKPVCKLIGQSSALFQLHTN